MFGVCAHSLPRIVNGCDRCADRDRRFLVRAVSHFDERRALMGVLNRAAHRWKKERSKYRWVLLLCGLLLCGLRAARAQSSATLDASEPSLRSWSVIPSLTQGMYIYRDHPTRGLTSASTARIALWIKARWLLSAAYRFSWFAPSSSALAAGYGATWRQHDGYVTAGYAAPRVGASLHYGVLSGSLDTTPDYAETSHHIGGVVRYSPWGDATLAATASVYPNEFLFRGELGWAIPILRANLLRAWSVHVRPAAALQWSAGELRPSGALSLHLDHPRVSMFVGGKYGTEVRPAFLAQEVVYNGPERIPLSLWAGVSFQPSAKDGTSLRVSYAFDRLLRDVYDASSPTLSTTYDSQAHYLTVGIARPF